MEVVPQDPLPPSVKKSDPNWKKPQPLGACPREAVASTKECHATRLLDWLYAHAAAKDVEFLPVIEWIDQVPFPAGANNSAAVKASIKSSLLILSKRASIVLLQASSNDIMKWRVDLKRVRHTIMEAHFDKYFWF